MILVDANILMHAVGADHPRKRPSLAFLERVGAGEIEASIDAEVLQELLHRYRSLNRWADGSKVYGLARQLFPDVVPVTAAVLDRAKLLMDRHGRLMARDALHAAVAMAHGSATICSYDRDLDVVEGLRRLEPATLKA